MMLYRPYVGVVRALLPIMPLFYTFSREVMSVSSSKLLRPLRFS